MERADRSATLYKATIGRLCWADQHSLSTDGQSFLLWALSFWNVVEVGFIGFHYFAFAAQRGETASTHALANAVRHEPSRPIGDTERAMELVGAHAFLARAH